MDIIEKYFTSLSTNQKSHFLQLFDLYKAWNEKINVISRKDIDNIYLHHVLHSLAIAKFIQFPKGTRILDLGTGGGFPAVPLAIFFPEIHITALDATNKKLNVIKEVAAALQLTNITTIHGRVEDHTEKYHYVVSRAVAPIFDLIFWSRPLISKSQISARPNGLICLKGGDLKLELREAKIKNYLELFELKTYFEESYFEDKKICYVQL